MPVEYIGNARAPADASAEQRETQLIRLTAIGDRQAFESLYLMYHRRLARFLTRITHRYDVAEEVINDTFWIVWCKAPQFRGDSRVSTWIMGIAYRRALKSLRKLRATVPVQDSPADDGALATDAADRTGELHEWLERALEQLPHEQRLVIELTYYLGHSCEEAATIMECPVNTVKTRMFHARRRLRMLLPQLDGMPDGVHK